MLYAKNVRSRRDASSRGTLFSGGSFEVNADKRHGLGEKATNKTETNINVKYRTRKPSRQYVKQVVLKFTLGTKVPLTPLKGPLFLGPVYMAEVGDPR